MVVDAGVDSMGGVIDGGVEIFSAPSARPSSYLEKTQADLRESFTTAEKFRRELEFLQKGGDPFDLKVGNGTSVSLQSTSLLDQHPEQFVTSEVKGSFAITASPHGDSVESSARLGAPSVGEPNSADNLMLFDGENKFHEVEKRSMHLHVNNTTLSDVAQEFPKQSYKRRNRSRSNRDGARSSSTDVGPRSGQPHLAPRHASMGVEHDDDRPVGHIGLVSKSRLDVKLSGNQTQKSIQPLTSDIRETPGHVEQETVKEAFESKSSGSRNSQSLDGKLENEPAVVIKNVDSNATIEPVALNKAPSANGNDVNTLYDTKALNVANDSSDPCPASHNDNGSTLTGDGAFKGSESALQHESRLLIKGHEDSILQKARIIEENRKRIAGSSVRIFSSESHPLSHWHFVLEEMSWLANDFAQERLWKSTVAAQISTRAAYCSRVRFRQQNLLWKQKQVAHILAEAVMEFWHTVQVKCHELEFEDPKKDTKFVLHQYGLRFLEYNSSRAQQSLAQAPVTPDRITDLGVIDIPWDDNLTEENLFYTVPPGAIEEYRKSIESHLLQCERSGRIMPEEEDVNDYDAVTAAESQDDTFEEDEGETSPYYLPRAFGGSRSSKPVQKKKNHFRPFSKKRYDIGRGSPFINSHERAIGPQPSMLSGKRPNNGINVSIPTKRMRTASRPRFTGPTNGFIHAPSRPDASSGDNNSFHDEESSPHGGSHMPSNMEAESVGDYEKQFDPTEVSNRPKKKKKIKHPGSMFDHHWQLDSSFQNEQKDHLKRRLDSRQFDSNGSSVASQTSTMSSQSKLMKLLVRDRSRKAKSLKTPDGQQGFGSPWSSFEDQGGARQLFQQLQEPMEEDTLKSHFETIIMIWQKHHSKKRQKDKPDRNQFQSAHDSHAFALSQVYPNNLNDGPALTPLDLCDTIAPSPDVVPVGYQGPHSGGLPVPNHVASTVPGSSPGSSLSGSSAMGLGNHLASASAPLSPSLREGRYGTPRSGSLSIDEQHRVQHLNQMSARNVQQSSLPPGSHSGTDRGIRMLPGGAGMGVMNGMNRSVAIARPAFQGIASPSLLNPGVTPGSLHPGPTPGQGNSVRPREALRMMRPNQKSEHQRQIMAPDGGMSSFPNPQQSPHMPHHLQGPPGHPAYGMRFIKERQLHQQRLLQQQFATSNPVNPHVQSHLQQPPQSQSSPPANQTPQHSQKRTVPPPPPHGLARNSQTGANLVVKQPSRQPPAGKHQPQQSVKLTNGFSGGQEKGSEQNGQQQKRHPVPGQPPTASSNPRQPPPPQKMGSQTQSTSGQRTISNRKENASESAQTSEGFNDSSGAVSANGLRGDGEHSGLA